MLFTPARFRASLANLREHRFVTFAVLTDTIGAGLTLPLTIVYFTITTDVPLAVIGVLSTVASLVALPIGLVGGLLEQAYDDVDYISAHAYYEEEGDMSSFLASGVNMDHFIDTVTTAADHVKAHKKSDKRIDISFDEWNVWSLSKWNEQQKTFELQDWPVAPRLLEDVYTVADAVVVGGLLITLLRHADRVASASIAQLVNVIGPIMTEPGGPAWRQTTFFPFSLTSRLANGTSLQVKASGDTVDGGKYGEVPVVDSAATVEDGKAAVFLVNRHQTETTTVTIVLAGLQVDGDVRAEGVWDDDVHAVNDLGNRERVGLRTNDTVRRDGDTITIELPPVSWTAVSIG